MSGIIPAVPREARQGVFFDGESAAAHEVRIVLDEGAGLLLLRGEGIDVTWKLDEVRLVPDQAGQGGLVLRSATAPMQRLFTAHRDLAESFPARHRPVKQVDRGRILRWALAAVASVALIVFVLVPTMADQLARFIPPEGEKALGDATLGQIRGALNENSSIGVRVCRDPEGVRAFDAMTERLAAGVDLPVDLTVTVLDHPMVNAFALPGGHIVFMRGLLKEAGTAEEVAAVFAHEMGHVASRDPTRHALRSAGSIGVLGLIFGDFAGGALVLFLAEQLIEAKYSQGAESDADVFAYSVLAKAGVAPSALGAMFERFRAKSGDAEGLAAHFLSHPALGDRIEAARVATPKGFAARPILSEAEWVALKGICAR
ncbi:M48 family metallopeptidase [Shimia sp. FJ5]|uniref:M48 family metallopeptidase n=1 Tax=Shimia sp. FJ5 TaxID=3079054 RepID=UPI00262A6CB9|nr:M48 family metallopeptidase [Shimia sp. FJ5]MDV4146602.1 M48 family metallopeptidase [Shimia sp. FJ5]